MNTKPQPHWFVSLFKWPRMSRKFLRNLGLHVRGWYHAARMDSQRDEPVTARYEEAVGFPSRDNPLLTYFRRNETGHGIWKWVHYFDAYHIHFKRFVGRPVNIFEIGIYSGGSMAMWRDYFGDQCKVFGMDIEPDCHIYENEYTQVFIGDQGDREFWRNLKKTLPPIDIFIDDGSPMTEHKIIALEEMLPHMAPGSVYLVEHNHGMFNKFVAYVYGMVSKLNEKTNIAGGVRANGIQSEIASIHFYPYLILLEKLDQKRNVLMTEKHGALWQPFYEKDR